MRFGSVCSGIGAPEQAWIKPLGWTCAFMSEIEAFPRAVLKHHHPETPCHGDFTTIKAEDYGPIDLLVGGTPCQSFSIAGLRAGLGDARGNLALEYLRLVDRKRPRWVVWENVCGVFSSLSHDTPDPRPPDIDLGGGDGPADGEEVVVVDEYDAYESHAFACFLAGLSELGYGLAYRVFDAQFTRTRQFPWAVPQRRRRVFVVGYLGVDGRGDWRPPAAVLFERESLQGHPPPRRASGQGFTCDVAPSLTGSGRGVERAGETRGQDPVIAIQAGPPVRTPPAVQAVAHSLRGEGFDASEDGTGRGTPLIPASFVPPISPALKARDAKGPSSDGDGDGAPLVVSFAVPINPNALRGDGAAKTPSMDAAGNIRLRDPGLGIGRDGDPADTLTAAGPGAVAFALRGREDGAVPEVEGAGDAAGALRAASGGSTRDYIAFTAKDHGADADDEVSPTLRSGSFDTSHANGGVMPAVAFSMMPMNSGKDFKARETDVAQPVLAGGPTGGNQGGDVIATAGRDLFGVRRLTPTECERLQGFPDSFTNIPWRGKPNARDGPRYKALGNSMAVNVMTYIGERIDIVDKIINARSDGPVDASGQVAA